MGCTHVFWMTPHASCPSESHERAGWDGRRKRLGLAGATGCPGKRRAPQAARGGTGCPGEVLSSSGFCSLDLIWPSKSTQLHFIAAARAPQAVRSKGARAEKLVGMARFLAEVALSGPSDAEEPANKRRRGNQKISSVVSARSVGKKESVLGGCRR